MYRVIVLCGGQETDQRHCDNLIVARRHFSAILKSLAGMNCDVHKSVTGLHSAYLWNDDCDVSVRIERAS